MIGRTWPNIFSFIGVVRFRAPFTNETDGGVVYVMMEPCASWPRLCGCVHFFLVLTQLFDVFCLAVGVAFLERWLRRGLPVCLRCNDVRCPLSSSIAFGKAFYLPLSWGQ